MSETKKVGGVKIDWKNFKPYKRERKVVDPPRFPKVILAYEKEMNDMFNLQTNKMVIDLTKEMVKLKK